MISADLILMTRTFRKGTIFLILFAWWNGWKFLDHWCDWRNGVNYAADVARPQIYKHIRGAIAHVEG